MARTVDYFDIPPFDDEVMPAPDVADWRSILRPGDLILARSEGSVISTLIQKLDGFFTHTAIYLGTDEDDVGWVAHSYASGVLLWNLNRLGDNYSDGALAWARPGYGEQRNLEAADWAKQFARLPTDDELLPYGYEDLGLSFALLVRSMWRRERSEHETVSDDEIDDLVDSANDALAKRPEGEVETSTCSAFAWRSYHEGAGRAIVPELIEGLRVEGGLLKHLDDKAERAASPGTLADRFKGKWGTLLLMASAFPGAAALLTPDRGALLSEAVSPGDLWCSPSMVKRGMLLLPRSPRE